MMKGFTTKAADLLEYRDRLLKNGFEIVSSGDDWEVYQCFYFSENQNDNCIEVSVTEKNTDAGNLREIYVTKIGAVHHDLLDKEDVDPDDDYDEYWYPMYEGEEDEEDGCGFIRHEFYGECSHDYDTLLKIAQGERESVLLYQRVLISDMLWGIKETERQLRKLKVPFSKDYHFYRKKITV